MLWFAQLLLQKFFTIMVPNPWLHRKKITLKPK